MAFTSSSTHTAEFEDVRRAEELEINRYRVATAMHRLPLAQNSQQHLSERPCGLALSGGGIRAAAFHLGALQGLAKHDILPWVDYVSSVSGGSFIAAWLSKWFSTKPYTDIMNGLKPAVHDNEPPEIRTVRSGSAYLTPRLGPFGTDTLFFVATYIHQLAIYLTVLVVPPILLLMSPTLALIS